MVGEKVVGVIGMKIYRVVIHSSLIAALSSSLGFYFAKTAASLEEWVVQGLLSCYPLPWVHLHHSLHEVEALLVDLAEVTALDGFDVVDLWKLHADELGILQEVFLVLGSERAKAFLDEVQLIEVILPREQRFSIDDFCHNAANGPDVNGPIVIIPADEQLWRPIPPGRHIIRHYLIIRHAPREAQVADLHCP